MNEQRERFVNHMIDLIELVSDSKLMRGMFCSDPVYAFAGNIADRLLSVGALFPPCKVGDTAYKIIRNNEPLGVAEYIVKGFHYGNFIDGLGHKRKNYLIVKHRTSCLLHHIPFDTIGKTVFLTKEEAEQALKECGV